MGELEDNVCAALVGFSRKYPAEPDNEPGVLDVNRWCVCTEEDQTIQQ